MNTIDRLGFHQQALIHNPEATNLKAIARMQKILGQIVYPIPNHSSQISASDCQSPEVNTKAHKKPKKSSASYQALKRSFSSPQKDSLPSGCFSPEKCHILTKPIGHIELMHGNPNITQSRVVFFSDIHDDYRQRAYQIQVLKELLQSGDILLYEGSSDNNPPFTSEIFAKKITIQSWENQQLFESDALAAKRSIEIFELLKSEKNPIIRTKLDKEFWELHTTVMNGIERRNTAMITNIRGHLASNQGRVFVIAGKKHLNDKLLNQFKGMQTTLFFKDQRKNSLLDSPISNETNKAKHTVINIRFPDGSISHYGIDWFNLEQGLKIGPGQKVKFKKELLHIIPTMNEPNAKIILENPEAEYEVASFFGQSEKNENSRSKL